MATNTNSLDLESGSSQFASKTDSSSLSQTGDMTFEAWINPESLPSNGYMGIGTKWDNSTTQKSYIFALNDNAGQKRMAMFTSVDGSSLTVAYVNISISAGTWYHIAWAYTAASGSFVAYLNGVSQGTGSGLDTSVFDGTNPFVLGATDGADYYDGLIDEARLWGVARNASQILSNMKTDVSKQPNLKGYWKLNNAYTDSSPNGNDLTASGSPVFSSTVPFNNYLVFSVLGGEI